jgi:DNA-binding CsgD family transcriptional regulator
VSIKLSDQQMRVVHLIDRGLSNEEIAREMGISPSTVKQHVRDLRLKLGVSRKRYIPHVVKGLGLLR